MKMRIFVSIALVTLISFPCRGEIKEELDLYFNPSFLQKEFYENNSISRLTRKSFTQADLEAISHPERSVPVYRFPIARFAPEDLQQSLDEFLLKGIEEEERRLERKLTDEEKDALKLRLKPGIERRLRDPQTNDDQADEAEAFALIPKSIDKIFNLLIDLDRYDEYNIVREGRYFPYAEQIREDLLRLNHGDKEGTELIAALKKVGILPAAESEYYQYSILLMDPPELTNIVRYHVVRKAEEVVRGKAPSLIRLPGIPTITVAWKVERRSPQEGIGTSSLLAWYDVRVNSGYVILQPYVNEKGIIFDGKNGTSPMSVATYHVYTKFDPTYDRKNDMSRNTLASRENATRTFIQAIATFLRF